MPHISVRLQLTLHDQEGHVFGRDTFVIGQKKRLPLHVIGYAMIKDLADFWLAATSDDLTAEVQTETQELARIVAEAKIEEEKIAT